MNAIVSQLLDKYSEDAEVEHCGLVLTDETLIDCENLSATPETGFRLPAVDLVKYEDKLAGTWHTHPKDKANLSELDYKGFANWPDIVHYIVGLDGVRAFKVDGPLIVELDV